jgi:hypothetical protein
MSTRTGPQRYPGANTKYWFQNTYPGDAMETNTIVWHSTEGTSLPSYGGGASAPNLTAVPDFAAKRLVWYQHFDFDVSARALVNAPGGVATNTLNVCQVEIVGTCDPHTHEVWEGKGYRHLYMPKLPDWAVRDLAAFAAWAREKHGVPLTSDVTWRAYPGSYGASGVRMSAGEWNGFTGHCGHLHVPENLHGDPGAMPMAAILATAKDVLKVEAKPAAKPAAAKAAPAKPAAKPAPKPALTKPAPAPVPDPVHQLVATLEKTHKTLGEQLAALKKKIGA